MSSKGSSFPNARSDTVIQAWLLDVQLETSRSQHHRQSDCPKRSSSPCPSPCRNRIPLAPAQANGMAFQKRKASNSPEGASTPKRHQILIDSEETPRARPAKVYTNTLSSYPTFQPPGQPASSSSDALSRSSTSQKSGSSSPIKSLSTLRMTKNPVEYSNKIHEMPSSGRCLYDELLRCKSTLGVLPSALKDDIVMAIDGMDRLSDFMFDQALNAPLGLHNELEQVKGILKRAERCKELHDAEPGWNEQVHSRVLELALEGQARVGFQNITTARIHPKAFNPKNVNGDSLQGKMVDYAICLELDPAEPMFDRMWNTMELEPTSHQYINHTSFDPVRFRPIAVSIETKVDGSEVEATIQLSVWVVAHFKRLQAIIQRSGVCPQMSVLPLIHILGHDWFATLAVQGDSKTILYGRINIGATDTILGIYKLLSALRVLRTWAETDYRNWFDGILVSTGIRG